MMVPGRRDREVLMAGMEPPGQCCEFLEVFGGVASVKRAATELRYSGQVYDVRQDPEQNVHTQQGLESLATMMAQVRPGGVAFVQPTCSSWGWVNRATSLRGVEACLHSCISAKPRETVGSF